MKYALFLICALSALPPAKALAASSEWMDITGGKARLIIAEPVPGAGNTDALLQVDLNPGWKTYWRDPGDAGVPLQLDFSASRNAKLVDVLYPVPKRFDDGVTIWAGYDRPVAFGLKLERPDSASPVSLKGSVFIGVCEKICVPVQLVFEVEAPDSATTTIQREVVALGMVQLPLAAFDNGVPPELFLAGDHSMQFKAPLLKSAGNGKAVFEAGILYWKPEIPGAPVPAHYTLVSGGESASGVLQIPAN